MAKIIPKFFGVAEKNKIKFYDPARFSKYMRGLEGKQVKIVVSELEDGRGLNQLRYLWGVVYQLVEEDTGTPREDVHEFAKAKFASRIIEVKGHEIRVPGSTKNMTWQELETFTARVRSWAQMELGLVIPARGEVDLSHE